MKPLSKMVSFIAQKSVQVSDMIIIGHKWIDYMPFYYVHSIEDIKESPSNSNVLILFSEDNLDLCKYCSSNNIVFGLGVRKKKEIVLASAIGASFLISDSKKLIKKAQKLAENYLFDMKIMFLIENEKSMMWAVNRGIDGILFERGVTNGSF